MIRRDDLVVGSKRLAFFDNGIVDADKLIQPKAAVLIVHGYAEHAQRYTHVGRFLAQHQIAAFGVDLSGHGHSTGERAFISTFDEYCQDVLEAIAAIQKLPIDLPLFVLGHSNGGLVTVKTILDHAPNLRGVILTGAALKIDDDLSPILRKLAPLMGKLFPKLQTVKLDSKLVSRDPSIVEAYEADPLVYTEGIKAGYGAAALRAIKEVGSRFGEISIPLLIMHGEADKLTDPRGSAKLAKEASSSDLTIKTWPGLYHEILNEPEKDRIMTLIVGWILERC